MGNYNLKSQILRCKNCSSIKKITIDPSVPQSFVSLECKCDISRIFLQNFLKELTKGESYKINCVICKKEDKNSYYCHSCNHIYCPKCIKEHSKHKYISISKADFYCVFHQKELFNAYCYDCSLNFCKKCEKEKKHLNHSCDKFTKLIMNKSDRNYLKEKFKLAENKLEFTNQFVIAFSKKLNSKEQKSNILNAERKNMEQNKNILEAVNFFIYAFDNTKYKNYNIIYNFIENINLNVNKFKFSSNNIGLEEAYKQIMKYLSEDFIIIKNDNLAYEKEKSASKRKKSIWDFDDENDIGTRQTMGAGVFNQMSLDKYNNYKENLNEKGKLSTTSSIIIPKSDNILKSQKNKNNNEDENNDNFYRPRSHAIFIPTKMVKQKIKEKNKNDLNDDEKENNNNLNDDEIENININEENGKIENNNTDDKKEEEKKIKKEIINKQKENKEEIKVEIINEKQNNYAKFIGINKYRNSNSLINKMMINELRKEKKYKIIIN